MKIAICYHCLFYYGAPPDVSTTAVEIVREQMQQLRESGLLDAASECIAGINGGEESRELVPLLLPAKFSFTLHRLNSRSECATIFMLEQWVKAHPDWYVLYFHAKGATHPADDDFRRTWRECMMRHLVLNWRRCVLDLEAGCEAAGCHWMVPPETPPGHHIFAGNFWWAKSSFLATLPSIMERSRIKMSGLVSLESRYESEVWLGNGKRLPNVKDYHPNWNPSKWPTCKPNYDSTRINGNPA